MPWKTPHDPHTRILSSIIILLVYRRLSEFRKAYNVGALGQCALSIPTFQFWPCGGLIIDHHVSPTGCGLGSVSFFFRFSFPSITVH